MFERRGKRRQSERVDGRFRRLGRLVGAQLRKGTIDGKSNESFRQRRN